MYLNSSILVVIPARGGSKGIPRKNLRSLNGVPLLFYSIDSALQSKYVDSIVLSTDDDEIASIGDFKKIEVMMRHKKLSGDKIPLDPVIFDVKMRKQKIGLFYDYYITLQPTMPLLSSNTIDASIEYIIDNNYDSVLGIVDETHLYWEEINGKLFPLYNERVNRQYLNKIYKECGYFVSNSEVVLRNSRLGNHISTYKIPKNESIDIDRFEDLWVVDDTLRRKKIAIRVIGNKNVGLGHIYRMLTFAGILYRHDVIFYVNPVDDLAIKKIKENNYSYKLFESEQEFLTFAKKDCCDIVVNDILDTTKEYIISLKENDFFVVNFEDLGEGMNYSDLLFNSQYYINDMNKNHYYGYNYAILKQDMYYQPPIDFNVTIKNVLLTFGGVDENNLTMRTLKLLTKIYHNKITITVGLGYQYLSELKAMVLNYDNDIEIMQNIKNMAQQMRQSDVAITSKGRTIYELVALQVPSITIAQNEREMTHLFSDNVEGIISLNRATEIEDEEITDALKSIILDNHQRKMNYHKLGMYNIKRGLDNVINILFEVYTETKNA
jgi:CMP-N-acetylneuraminic acid synthetase/spore coat polysaccharide biosynthesis predicted glycosyltransferase SpsG